MSQSQHSQQQTQPERGHCDSNFNNPMNTNPDNSADPISGYESITGHNPNYPYPQDFFYNFTSGIPPAATYDVPQHQDSTTQYRRNNRFRPNYKHHYYNGPRYQAQFYFNRNSPWRQHAPWKQNRYSNWLENKRQRLGARSRSPPLVGSEEDNQRKIQETSDMIKRQLLLPSDSSMTLCESNTQRVPATASYSEQNRNEETNATHKQLLKQAGHVKPKAGNTSTNAQVIHSKIIKYLSNLKHGKKVNLISSSTNDYDLVIGNIQKQKRLNLSRALRALLFDRDGTTTENADFINSIIPDIGVNLHDLPLQVIQELSSTLNLDSDSESGQNIKQENVETSISYSENVDDNVEMNNALGGDCDEVEYKIKVENIEVGPLDVSDDKMGQDDGFVPNEDMKHVLNFDVEGFENFADSSLAPSGDKSDSMVSIENTSNEDFCEGDATSFLKTELNQSISSEDEEVLTDDFALPHTATTTIATMDALPSKSREKYLATYQRFKQWCTEKNVENVTQNVLIEYFLEMSKMWKSSTLWSLFSMLKACLNIHENIDIAKFSRLLSFLKRKSQGFRSQKSRGFTKEQYEKFIREAPDEKYLMMKVGLILGVAGACSREELTYLNIDNIEDLGSVLLVKIADTKNKVQRHFTVVNEDESDIDLVAVYRKYAALRPSQTNDVHRRFFLSYRSGKCTSQVLGVNSIGKIPVQIATFLKLINPSEFTGHCFRRTAGAFLVKGAAITNLRRLRGVNARSEATEESELEDLIPGKKNPRFTEPSEEIDCAPHILTSNFLSDNELSTSFPSKQNCASLPITLSEPPTKKPHSPNQSETMETEIERRTSSTQTDFFQHDIGVQTPSSFTEQPFDSTINLNPLNMNEAISTMLKIDAEIQRLTLLRQNLIINVNNSHSTSGSGNNARNGSVLNCANREDKKVCSEIGTLSTDYEVLRRNCEFEKLKEKILVIDIIKDTLIMGTERGKLIFFEMELLTSETKQVCHTPITSICHWTAPPMTDTYIYVGCLEAKSSLKTYENETRRLTNEINIDDGIQCLEIAWDFLFIGTQGGLLKRYNLKIHKVVFEERISQQTVFILKSAQEGARRVLLVGTRNAAVCVRDAMSGLLMRTMDTSISPTVYSLVTERSLIYCGTAANDVLVYNFQDGSMCHRYSGSNLKGVGCLQVLRNLLFAGCHDGNVYVYDVRNSKNLGMINCGLGVILAMRIFKNVIFIGGMSCQFRQYLIPESFLQYNK